MPVFKKQFRSQIWRNTKVSLRMEARLPGIQEVADEFKTLLRSRSAPVADRSGKRTKENSQTGNAVPGLRKKIAAQDQKLKRARRRIAKQERQLTKLKAELTVPRNVHRPPTVTPQGSAPVFFVLGVAKSGTSWLMRMLDSHPEILCMGEGQFFGAEWRHEDRRQYRFKLVSSLYNALLDSEYLKLWIERSVWTRDGDANEHLNKLTHAAIQHFLSERLSRSGKKIVGDKSLLTPKLVEEIHLIYPEAKIIHIIRDGRDQAVSMIHHLWNRASAEGGIRQLTPEELRKRDAYRENPKGLLQTGEGIFAEERLRTAARGWAARVIRTVADGPTLFGANYIEVRYEDLLEHPHEEVAKLARFLGANADEEFIERAVDSVSFEKLTEGRKRGQEDTASFFRKGVAGDWRNVFTDQDKRIFKEEAGELLIELGYERDNDW